MFHTGCCKTFDVEGGSRSWQIFCRIVSGFPPVSLSAHIMHNLPSFLQKKYSKRGEGWWMGRC